MRTLSTSNLINTPTTITLAPTPTATSNTIITAHHSLWNSPIPYLFGGLAAMFGLIAFALLILGFSYRALMRQLQTQVGGRREMEKEGDPQKKESVKVYDEKLLVIMAGEEKPTFLATPVCPKSLSFEVGDGRGLDKQFGDPEVCDRYEKEMHNNHHVVVVGVGSTSTQENEACQEIQQQQLQYPVPGSIPVISDNGTIPVSVQPRQHHNE